MGIKSKRLVLTAALVVPFLTVTALMVSAGSGQVVPAPAHAKVHSVEVMPLHLQSSYTQQKLAYGRVEATRQSRMGFELTGTLTQVLVNEGQQVAAGDVLATLDTQRLQARQLELKASLARAEADQRLAKLSANRIADLVAKKLESSQRLDEVTEATAAAGALVDEIKARLASLDVELGKSQLKAPFDGYVISQTIDPGTVVGAGQNIIELQQAGGYEVKIALAADDAFSLYADENYLLKKGQELIPAKLKSIAKQRSLSTRTVEAIFTLDATLNDLLPGDLLAFSYEQSFAQSGVWVPRQALSSGVRGLWTLYTVKGNNEKHLSQKSVELLYTEPERAYVRGTLSEGELLVVNGVQRLVPGQLVTVSNTAESLFALESGHGQ